MMTFYWTTYWVRTNVLQGPPTTDDLRAYLIHNYHLTQQRIDRQFWNENPNYLDKAIPAEKNIKATVKYTLNCSKIRTFLLGGKVQPRSVFFYYREGNGPWMQVGEEVILGPEVL
jgi:hypothetical protein